MLHASVEAVELGLTLPYGVVGLWTTWPMGKHPHIHQSKLCVLKRPKAVLRRRLTSEKVAIARPNGEGVGDFQG